MIEYVIGFGMGCLTTSFVALCRFIFLKLDKTTDYFQENKK